MASSKKFILCVDDDQAILESLKAQLKFYYKDRFEYEMVPNAKEGLEAIHRILAEGNKIVVVISDWLLENMRGDQFLVEIHKKYPNINTVLLTGHASEEAIENVKKNANVLTCLNKPWSLEDLVFVINLSDKSNS